MIAINEKQKTLTATDEFKEKAEIFFNIDFILKHDIANKVISALNEYATKNNNNHNNPFRQSFDSVVTRPREICTLQEAINKLKTLEVDKTTHKTQKSEEAKKPLNWLITASLVVLAAIGIGLSLFIFTVSSIKIYSLLKGVGIIREALGIAMGFAIPLILIASGLLGGLACIPLSLRLDDPEGTNIEKQIKNTKEEVQKKQDILKQIAAEGLDPKKYAANVENLLNFVQSEVDKIQNLLNNTEMTSEEKKNLKEKRDILTQATKELKMAYQYYKSLSSE